MRRRVAVIAAAGGAHLAAKSATTKIPIVCAIGSDPVKFGLIESLNRPGGNITGMTVFSTELEAKRLELMHELVPKATIVGVLVAPKFHMSDVQVEEIRNASGVLALQVHIAHAGTDNEIEKAIMELVKNGVGALLLTGGPLFNNNRRRVVALTANHRLPAIAGEREFTEVGGLMSYGTNVPDVYRQIGIYSGRILQGEKPSGSAVRATVEVRFRRQFEDSKVARPRSASDPSRPRRRGDRMTRRELITLLRHGCSD
jgi:putative tryptophan/tyrosine transport system substrate-binding protein